MSKAQTPFLEGSKHQALSAMVEGHFMGENRSTDATGMSSENAKGANATNSLPVAPKPNPFNTPDSGVNYVPRERAGHTTAGDDWFNPDK